ncbi:MAG: sigma-70 family RNA polymerase sigma factor [Xanthomonadales bacterium]|nr:sigma-70 family RNA polymerase sigma factor [Xanthomonadales bacterium]
MSRDSADVDARLEQVLSDFGSRLGALMRSYRLDRHGIDPDDVEQEVRIRLWKAISRDRSGAFHASYVQKVVATTVIDALRRAEVRAAEPLPEDDDEPGQLPEEGIGPEQTASDGERMGGFAALPGGDSGASTPADHLALAGIFVSGNCRCGGHLRRSGKKIGDAWAGRLERPPA